MAVIVPLETGTAGASRTGGAPLVDAASQQVMLSSLSQYGYCPRRCGLILIEQTFEENLFTLRGTQVHERAHKASSADLGDVRVERALPIFNDELGLYGVADVVEFHPDGTIQPIEYKPGEAPKGVGPADRAEALQLCGQALCLESMFKREIPRGSIYYYASRQRKYVNFTSDLRERTLHAILAVRHILSQTSLPNPVDDARCPKCSLIDACLPAVVTAMANIGPAVLFRPSEAEGLE